MVEFQLGSHTAAPETTTLEDRSFSGTLRRSHTGGKLRADGVGVWHS